MTESIIGDLLPESKRSLAQNLFSGFYERGLTANDALQELRDMGLGYRRTEFLKDYRQGKSDYDQATAIRYVSPQNTPTDRILEERYHGVPDKYSFVFRYDYTNEQTGEDGSGYFFYHRNTMNSRASMENDAYDYLSSNSDKYGYDVSSVTLVEGYINPVWG